jgi:DNA-binding NarL/FixJ family response regulator
MAESSLRALVVEDDDDWQDILGEILRDTGLEVDYAADFEAAEVCLRAAAYRLAVVDLSLSPESYHNRDGLRVLEAVRAYAPGCTALLLTGYATVELAVEAMTVYGAHTCLRKETFRRAAFRELLWRLLAKPLRPMPVASDSPADQAITVAVEAPAGAAATAKPAGGGPAGISAGLALVVENDAGWRSILAELLDDAGYQVRACGSYGEALGYLLREQPALTVVDLSLTNTGGGDADRDGYHVLAQARDSGVPAIVVSGLAAASEARRAYTDYGIFAYLEKQAFDRQMFLRTVATAVAASPAPTAPPVTSATAAAGVDPVVVEQLASLTPREREVLELLVRGLTNKGIANQLVISVNTVKRYLKLIFEKLEVNSRAAAAAKAVSSGIK